MAEKPSKEQAQAANMAFIQQMMAKGKDSVEVIGGDAPEPAPEGNPSPTPEQPAADAEKKAADQAPAAEAPAADAEMDQDAIDAMMAARAEKKAADPAPAEEAPAADAEMDQDAIDAMMAARAEKKTADPAPSDEAPADQAPAEEAPADDAEMDQDAIDAMMAARAEKKTADQAPAEEEATLDQDAIDAMMTSKSTAAPAAEAPAAETNQEVDQDAIDAMMAAREKAKAEPKSEPVADSGGAMDSDKKLAAVADSLSKGKSLLRKWSLAHWLFFSNGLMGLILVLSLSIALSGKSSPDEATASMQDEEGMVPSSNESVRLPKMVIPEVGPTTWAEAEEALLSQRYELALARYRKLMGLAEVRWDNQRIIDLLKLRSGQCLLKLGQAEKARKLFIEAAQSDSPIVRAYANYRLGLLRVDQGLYMRARTRGYMAIAALGMLDSPTPLEADCDYLIASCLTRKVMSFFRPDEKIHWSDIQSSDPFMGVNEDALLRLIAEGTDKTRRSVLGPMLKPAAETSGFDATCWRAPLTEVMHRFETQSGLDVSWVAVGMPVRRRPVTMFLRGASAQRVSEVACGVVELVANFTGSNVMVHDIRAMNSVAQARGLLTRQAVSAWRQFFLRRPDDPRVAHGHLALARLCEAEGDRVSAVREYQLIAERYRDHPAAPEAMMRSARLKIDLLDYDGARKDLLDLLDSYPDFHATDQLYLSLGNATLEAGLHDEASGVYRKLYYLNLSPETQAQACLGIGRCMTHERNWDEAIRWLGRYIERTPEQGGDDLVDGMVLMAKAHTKQDRLDEALKYLYPAISIDASNPQNIRATLALADVQILKDNLVRATGAISRIPKRSVPKEYRYDYYRVKSEVYAGMGLFNRALSELREGINETEDLTLRARLGVQVGRIYVQAGELKSALRVLTDVVGSGQLLTGPIAQSAACDLGRVCVNLGKADQAVSAVRDVLATTGDEDIRARARDILGTAYAMRKEFNKSADVLSGRAEKRKTGGSQ